MGPRMLPTAPVVYERLVAVVSGRVQGVGYRMFAREMAHRIGVGGEVRNRAGGTVEVVAEGRPSRLDDFEAALRRGPFAATVDGVDATREPIRRRGRARRFVVR